LGNRMMTDEVHALSMRTYSPSEWEKMSDAEKAGT
jgi:acid stress-induced BolA-like protein IbaG/YrbA